MKQNITLTDLNMLSDGQKKNLRSIWLPAVNDLVVAKVCKDVVNDEYDYIPFVVGQIIIKEGSGGLVLRKYSVIDEIHDDDDDDLDEDISLEDEDDDLEEFDFEYQEPEQYFNKEDCLPLLSIGQIMYLLNRLKFGQEGFYISIPPTKKYIGDKGITVSNTSEIEHTAEELCDALWQALIECL